MLHNTGNTHSLTRQAFTITQPQWCNQSKGEETPWVGDRVSLCYYSRQASGYHRIFYLPSMAGECNSLASTCQAFFSLCSLSLCTKGCGLVIGVGRERRTARGLQGSVYHSPPSFGKETLHFWISSFLHYEGNRRMEKGKKENREVISDTAKYTSEMFNLGKEGVIKWMLWSVLQGSEQQHSSVITFCTKLVLK